MPRSILAAALLLSTALVTAPLARQADPAGVTARGEWTADARSWSSDDGPRLQLNLRSTS